MYGPCRAFVVAAIVSCIAAPGAGAHTGPSNPTATNYLARLGHVPPGLDANVVDGDLRMWLAVPADSTAVVLDYRGAPYLRFDRSGVAVNHNSEMYYLNQTPVAETPPGNLTATTPPDWHEVSRAHSYVWHDGRLHALASVAVPPGTRAVGGWSIPVVLNGGRVAISGVLWHAGRPSIVWFWPIIVICACLLAATRLRRLELSSLLVRALGCVSLIAIAAAEIGRGLHGHPDVSATQYAELAIVIVFVLLAGYRIATRRARYVTNFAIALVALWEGFSLIQTLRDGFVLIDLPAFIARTVAVLCLAGGAAMVLATAALADLTVARTGRLRSAPAEGPDGDELDVA